MSNKPKIGKSKTTTYEKVKTPARLRLHHHVGDMAGCGTIRVIFPSMILNNYFSPKYQFEAIFNNRYIPFQGAYGDCSFVTFQRSATEQQFQMIGHFKKMNPGKKIYYEIDDLLMGIPEWNFASSFYNTNQIWVERILAVCDGIICSTPMLRKQLLKYNKNINVSLNHLPKFIWGQTYAKEVEEDILHRKLRIMYAGSHNHFDQKSDKGDFSPELIDFVKKTTDKYQWIFIGGSPKSLQGNDEIIFHQWLPVLEYPSFIKSMNPDIFLAPLEDNLFNKCKSNIKALESVALGIPLIATDIETYEGIPYTCKDTEMMIGRIEELAGNIELRGDVWKRQHDAVKSQLFWEDNEYANMFDYINQHLHLSGRELDI